MDKQTIVIIGGSGTIGEGIAKEVIKDGFEVHLIGRNKDLLEKKSSEISCSYNLADVNDSDQLVDCLKSIKKNIFGLVYCVGSINLKSLTLASEDDYIQSFKINTLGAILSIKALKDVLKKNNGSILLFSSIAASQGFINHSIVSTSKAAVEGLTLSLAAELSPNIRVNCLAPSLTISNMTKKIISNELVKKTIEDLHPIPKLGTSNDYCKIASFLLSKHNQWITGQIIHIDGGRSTIRKKG